MIIHPLKMGYGYCFLIETPAGLFLIDSGFRWMESVVLRKMEALGRNDLKLIWITHAHIDHYGSAAALRRKTGALIGIHPADAEIMIAGRSPSGTTRGIGFVYHVTPFAVWFFRSVNSTKPDFTLEDGETLHRFGLPAAILHTPGHTPGHTCVLLEDGTAFASDLIGRFPHVAMQHLLAMDWDQLPPSLEKLKAANPHTIYTGHSPIPISGTELRNIKP